MRAFEDSDDEGTKFIAKQTQGTNKMNNAQIQDKTNVLNDMEFSQNPAESGVLFSSQASK